jgi:phytoene synthase
MEMDVPADIHARHGNPRSLATASPALSGGCRCGSAWARRRGALAHHLGRALQLTNILRDIDEDAGLAGLSAA